MIGLNLDTSKRSPPLINLMGYEYREDAVGGGVSRQWKHAQTHTHSVPCDTQNGWILGQRSDAILTHVSMTRPLSKLLRSAHRE